MSINIKLLKTYPDIDIHEVILNVDNIGSIVYEKDILFIRFKCKNRFWYKIDVLEIIVSYMRRILASTHNRRVLDSGYLPVANKYVIHNGDYCLGMIDCNCSQFGQYRHQDKALYVYELDQIIEFMYCSIEKSIWKKIGF